MADGVLESFTCPICLDIAENAVETTCCHNIFCNHCLSMLGKHPCPQCRQNNFTFTISYVSRRIIGNLPVECSFAGCKDKVVKSELNEHLKKCQHRTFCCPSESCSFEGNKKDFAAHLAVEHEDILAQNASKCFEKTEHLQQNQAEDRIATTRNAAGRTCRLGSTGKFYCGSNLDGPRCGCCNGRCGPTNGCNCSACMKTDVQMRKLPKSWYVNRDGAASRSSQEYPHYYCGRCVLEKSRMCDGYCGPTNGPNCDACRILETQLHTRYSNVWPTT